MPGAFVGRRAELAALGDLSRQVIRNRVPGVAVVVGDPGSGKSRLLAEFQRSLPKPRRFQLCGYELEQQVPLSCARRLLDELGAVPGGGLLDELVFGERAGAAPVELIRVFEAAHRSMATLGPSLVLVDDLHWSDDTSLALLHYLIRAADVDRRAVLVVAASRRSARASGLLDSAARTLGDDRVQCVELGPFDLEDGTRLARELARELDQDGAEELWRAAQGSPFWMEILASAGGSHTTVDAIVAGRLRPLGDDAASMVTVLALAGRPMVTDDLAEVLRWPAGRVERAVSALAGHGLAVADAGASRVAHDLIRDAVLRTIPATAKRRVHGRIGKWLADAAGDDEQTMLAALEHLHRGGVPVTTLAARLAASPRRRLLGVAGLRRLSAILDDGPPGDEATEQLLFRLAALAEELGDHDESLLRWSACAAAADPLTAAAASLHASSVAMVLGLHRDAWRHWTDGHRRAAADEALAVELEARRAELLWYLDHLVGECRIAAEAALAAGRQLAERSGGVDALSDAVRHALLKALSAATASALSVGHVAAVLSFADEQARLAAGFDERVELGAIAVSALALRLHGDNAAAEARLRPAWDQARRHVLPQATLEVGAVLGAVLRSAGRLAEAEEIVDECVALGERLVEFGPARAVTVALPHLLELSRGDWHRAIDGLRQSAAAEEDPHYRLHAHLERAAALAFLDPIAHRDEASEAVRSARADAERARCRRCIVETIARGAEALARIGDIIEAQSLLARCSVDPSDAYGALNRHRAAAAMSAALGHSQDAIRELQVVIDEAERQGLQLEALWSRLDLAALLAPQDREHAVDAARAAGSIAARIGARTEERVADRLLRSLGVHTWKRGARSGWLALTPREQEITRLVCAGATNPEIAAALFLSRKTIERHVSNILAKLGLRNRAELAAQAAELARSSTP